MGVPDSHGRTMKFNPGRIVATANAIATFTREQLRQCLHRHLAGDWGDLSKADEASNEEALRTGERLLSAYDVPDPRGGHRLWIITEADRSATTLLLPEDY